MRHTLSNGRKVQLQFARLQGLWEDDEGVITIDSRLRGRGLLEAVLHEVLHAEMPTIEEEDVERTAASQVRAVWHVIACSHAARAKTVRGTVAKRKPGRAGKRGRTRVR